MIFTCVIFKINVVKLSIYSLQLPFIVVFKYSDSPVIANKQIICHPHIIYGLFSFNSTINVRVIGYISRSVLILTYGLLIANYKFIIPDEVFGLLAVPVVLYPWWSPAFKEKHEGYIFIRKVLVLRGVAPYRSVNNFAGDCCLRFQGMHSSKTEVDFSSEMSINI